MPDERSDTVFLGWLDRHGSIVLKVARAYTRTAADCQDLAQDILLQLWRSAPRFEGRAGEGTWVYRVALNTALGWRRKESRRRARHRRRKVSDDEPPLLSSGRRRGRFPL